MKPDVGQKENKSSPWFELKNLENIQPSSPNGSASALVQPGL
jgi:hypothetical protein